MSARKKSRQPVYTWRNPRRSTANKKASTSKTVAKPPSKKKPLYATAEERRDAAALHELDKALCLSRAGDNETATLALKWFFCNYCSIANLGPRTKERLLMFYATNDVATFEARQHLLWGCLPELRDRLFLYEMLLRNRLPDPQINERARRNAGHLVGFDWFVMKHWGERLAA